MKTTKTENENYQEKKKVFASLTKEAKALNLKDIQEGHSDIGEEEVYGILPKKYKDTSDIQVILMEVDKDPLGEGK